MYVCPECGSSAAEPGVCARDGHARADNAKDELLGAEVGSYRVAAVLGTGGMGTVYKGVHPRIGSRVAIKVLHAAVADLPDTVSRFFAEARAVNAIRHEGIVNVFDVGETPDGRPFILMELLEGHTLGELIATSSPLPVELVIGVVADVCDALEAAHARGIWHRDVKPHNVFVTASGRTKLLDFGVAKLRREGALAGGTNNDLVPITTVSGLLVGTPHYVSPEHAAGTAIDHRSDLYALGVVLYEALTGQKLWTSDSLYQLLQHHIRTPPPSPRAVRPDVPPALEAAVLCALAKRPANRFGTAAAMAAALRGAFQEMGTEAATQAPSLAGGAATAPTVQAPSTPITARRPARDTSPPQPPAAASGTPIATVRPAAPVAAPARNPATRAARAAGARRRWVVAGVIGVALASVGVGLGVGFVMRGAGAEPSDERAGIDRTVQDMIDDRYLDTSIALPRLLRAVRNRYPDAELTQVSVIGVNADGVVELDAPGSRRMNAHFSSQRAALCGLFAASAKGATWEVGTRVCTGTAPVPLPRCSLRQVLERAHALDAARSSAGIWAVSYQRAEGGERALWVVDVTQSDVRTVTDDC